MTSFTDRHTDPTHREKTDIAECLRVYRAGLDSYAEVVHKLRDSWKAADGIPIPELAVQLREERRRYDQLLRQAKQAGVELRYDAEEVKSEEL